MTSTTANEVTSGTGALRRECTAFLDIEAVVIDGSFCRPLLNRVIVLTREALQRYNWEGLWPATVIAGDVGPDARALGGALLPLHANFAPDQDLFLKVGA